MASKKAKIICAALCALWFVLLIVSYVLPKEETTGKPETEIVNCFVGAAPVTISGSIVQYRNYSLLKMNLHNRDTTPVSALKVFIRCYSAYDDSFEKRADCKVGRPPCRVFPARIPSIGNIDEKNFPHAPQYP